MMSLKVSKEFMKEFNKLKVKGGWAVTAMNEVLNTRDKYPALSKFLYQNDFGEDIDNQALFARIWADEIDMYERPDLYIVWVKGSKTEKGLADFMYFGDEEDDDNNAIDVDYNNRFNTVKENYNYLFSKEKAFKLCDTGYFEIERVD